MMYYLIYIGTEQYDENEDIVLWERQKRAISLTKLTIYGVTYNLINTHCFVGIKNFPSRGFV